jgi:hypothetical protein
MEKTMQNLLSGVGKQARRTRDDRAFEPEAQLSGLYRLLVALAIISTVVGLLDYAGGDTDAVASLTVHTGEVQ